MRGIEMSVRTKYVNEGCVFFSCFVSKKFVYFLFVNLVVLKRTVFLILYLCSWNQYAKASTFAQCWYALTSRWLAHVLIHTKLLNLMNLGTERANSILMSLGIVIQRTCGGTKWRSYKILMIKNSNEYLYTNNFRA